MKEISVGGREVEKSIKFHLLNTYSALLHYKYNVIIIFSIELCTLLLHIVYSLHLVHVYILYSYEV